MDNEDKLIVLTQAALRAGVVPSALEDILRRGITAFQARPLDTLSAEQWVAQLRPHLPAYFRGAASAAVPAGTVRARRPQPVNLSPAQEAALQALPPTQRLTVYRQLQQRGQEG